MKIAYSPCPNDTFTFYAWAHGRIEAPLPEVVYADIDQTNQWAEQGTGPEMMKISYGALPWVLDQYQLLPCGGALGRGCGPLVLTKDTYTEPVQLSGKTVAVPSERSTAYLLFRLWAEEHVPGGLGHVLVMPFHEIMPAVAEGTIDAGLVIHEARFTYPEYGLHELQDLGSWWETATGHPIPLGAIVAKRSLDAAPLASYIRASLEYAWAYPDETKSYVREHAQEMNDEVAKQHIDLYVNEFTRDLGESGYQAIEELLGRAAEKGLVPSFKETSLW
ncbi:1,4-dihydroxy-6-naphthoate synthase [Salsuginibacillus kocurii]|uniref:1,4-dihydroxy-6-naphthoate synthase n=1 Tax=Salsuginibacillus kocurii TaxID=427078 RepID=UPI00036EC22A|nr:1,4-dihydroxy-6-naphthoate synthase [Salsuginibacillus kocurii]